MKGVLRLNEPLAPYTAWHIGGQAERYYRPTDVSDLITFLSSLSPEEPLTWLGLGSNVLIADEGIKGTVIHTLGMEANEPEILSMDPISIRVPSGLPCAKLAKFCAKQGIVHAEFFAGIPGTIGGALTMNAGAFGGETWSFVEKVEVINRFGERCFRFPKEYQISYRHVKLPAEEWFIAGYFRFEKGDAIEASNQIKQLLRRRSDTQPIGVFSCGSVFKNPQPHFAAKLIESANLKGYRVGDIEVSPKHANFIINHGKGKAKEVLEVIHHIQETVWKNHQIRLEPEVRLLGF